MYCTVQAFERDQNRWNEMEEKQKKEEEAWHRKTNLMWLMIL